MLKNKKKKISPPSIQFIYPNAYRKTYFINQLTFDEQQVIQGSILFFDDPEPCMIHKGAVISRYIEEIHQWMKTIDSSIEYPISSFPKDLIEKIEPTIVKDAQLFRIVMENISEN